MDNAVSTAHNPAAPADEQQDALAHAQQSAIKANMAEVVAHIA